MTLRYRVRKFRRQLMSAVPLILVASLYVIGDRVSSESGEPRSPSVENVEAASASTSPLEVKSADATLPEEVCGWDGKADRKAGSLSKKKSDEKCSRKSE